MYVDDGDHFQIVSGNSRDFLGLFQSWNESS